MVYVAFIFDVFSRRIVGWRAASSMTTELVLDTLEMAIWARSRDGVSDLIVAVAPDVLVKGADWAEGDIVGRAEVLARGGRVQRVAVVPGVSTSELLRRIRGRP